MESSSSPRGWHNRGYLPHFDGGEICQFITLHLGDALPPAVVEKWRLELDLERFETNRQILDERINRYLDQGYGACWLKRPKVAGLVEESLLKFVNIRYKLHSWVVMPNHTHFLITPQNGWDLSDIIQGHKSYTAHEANKLIDRSGQFWQEDYFDRYIRDEEHYWDTIQYIEMNPVKAKLCDNPEDWRFGSARRRKDND